jgi:hypothetical protein
MLPFFAIFAIAFVFGYLGRLFGGCLKWIVLWFILAWALRHYPELARDGQIVLDYLTLECHTQAQNLNAQR